MVVGHKADQVSAHLAEIAPQAVPVLQAQQNGTGHAVRIALDAVPDATGTVVVLNGDVPLLRPQTVEALVAAHEQGAVGATVLAAEVADPTGLGRIVRDAAGRLERIVEERDASAEIRAIREINAGIYAFDATLLREALGKLSTDNDQGEEYLTDVFGLLAAIGHPVAVHVAADHEETLGCNDRAELAGLRALLRDRVNARVDAGRGVDPRPGDHLDRRDGAARGRRGDRPEHPAAGYDDGGRGRGGGAGHRRWSTRWSVPGATVLRTHSLGAEIGPDATVGPFSYLRPGTTVGCEVEGRRVRRDEERRRWASGRRCRTCRTWGTRRSGRAPTSARARSSPTTTG